ncbi:PEP-utilizing enzyme [Streptomyces sp. 4N509B]|uniref:PEP-utilizing enzyme n=1 Tax=Streptomyces sp. 4N509B TaxID=3457413 RepID=UPI003FD014BE
MNTTRTQQTATVFGTKAETLRVLAPLVRSASVLPQVAFTVSDWRADADAVLDDVLAQPWGHDPLIVRSSAQNEDSDLGSQAGRFHSQLGVVGRQGLDEAVGAVIASYGEPRPDDQVLVQPELRDVRASGVACGCDPSSGAPYRVVSWADQTSTTAVTGGRTGEVRTWYGISADDTPTAWLRGVVLLVEEIASLAGGDRFEVEFGITGDGSVILFQARPLVLREPGTSRTLHGRALATAARRLAELAEARSPVLGKLPLYGVMPDWNPAEIIGLRPRPLARSLYQALITDDTWARARHAYGYRDLRGTPLMVEFAGLPFIDVRASFNSFVPATLPDDLAARLVDHYVARLRERPDLHDKVEFEVVFSCNTFDLRQRLEVLAEHGFTAEERDLLRTSLVDLTNRLVSPRGLWCEDTERLKRLSTRPHETVVDLLDVCREYGARPFAGLARAGFVGMQLLNGLVTGGALSDADRACLLQGLNTVAGSMSRDYHTLERAEFLARYGHLRPGTYDILSPRYDAAPDLYFDWNHRGTAPEPVMPFSPSTARLRLVERLLHDAGFSCAPEELLDFIALSITARERAKFEFTRTLSDLLDRLGLIGASCGVTVDQLSYIDIDSLGKLVSAGGDPAGLRAAAEAGRREHRAARSLMLPPLLWAPEQVRSFELPDVVPNFVTHLRVHARVADIDRGDPPEGAIALVTCADPGYDWLFARGIVGLVTAYGGINSHMAIRAQELGVPTVTGVGEQRFRSWRQAPALEIDCANRLVRIG